MSDITKWIPPTIQELTEHLEDAAKDDVLNLALNQEPPQRWLKEHPTVKVKVKAQNGAMISVPLQYVPIDKQRLLGKRMFGIVEVEIRSVAQLFNAVCVTVRLNYKHPITGEKLFMDGVGGVGVQTDAGATASDMSKIKFDGVMKAAPAAAAYAEKNAYDKLGRVFGGDVQKDAIRFDDNWAMYAEVAYNNPDLEDVKQLYEMKKEICTPEEIKDFDRIIAGQEKASYKKIVKILQSK